MREAYLLLRDFGYSLSKRAARIEYAVRIASDEAFTLYIADFTARLPLCPPVKATFGSWERSGIHQMLVPVGDAFRRPVINSSLMLGTVSITDRTACKLAAEVDVCITSCSRNWKFVSRSHPRAMAEDR